MLRLPRWPALQGWKGCGFRRDANVCGAGRDQACSLYIALLATLPCLKLWLWEGKPELALLGLTHSLLALAVAAACAHPPLRQLYIRHRELAVTLASLHSNLVCRCIALHGCVNAFETHGGSPLRLLGLLLLCSHWLFGSLYFVTAQLSYSWSCLALPFIVALPVLTERSLCYKVLAAPGIEAPLAQLHGALQAVHDFASVTPAARLRAPHTSSPMEQCIAVEGWLLMVAGIMLPLAALAALERWTRHAWEQRQRRLQPQLQEEEEESRWGAYPEELAAHGHLEGEAAETTQHETLYALCRPLFQSSVAWAIASLVAATCSPSNVK